MVSTVIHNFLVIFFQIVVQLECVNFRVQMLSFMHISCLFGYNGDSEALEIKYKFKVPWQNIVCDIPWLQLFICIPWRWKSGLAKP